MILPSNAAAQTLNLYRIHDTEDDQLQLSMSKRDSSLTINPLGD